jgi:hypothetical protein
MIHWYSPFWNLGLQKGNEFKPNDVQVNSYQPTTNELDLKGANGLSSRICLKRKRKNKV